MTLTEAIESRDNYRSKGVCCQLECMANGVWRVIFWGINYQ